MFSGKLKRAYLFAVFFAAGIWSETIVSAANENLIKNPGFESGKSSWKFIGGAQIQENEFKNGTKALKLPGSEKTDTKTRCIQKIRLNQKTPTPLKVGCWMKADALSVSRSGRGDMIVALDMVVYYNDGGKPDYIYEPLRLRDTGLVGKWVYKEYVFVPPKPVRAVSIWPVNRRNKGNVYFDDISLSIAGKKTLTAKKAGDKPLIDGKLNDESWKESEPVSEMMLYTGEGKAEIQTKTKILYDERGIYFGIKCKEPQIKKLKSKVKEHDSWVWRDDSVELFIDPLNGKESYYHIAVNSDAVVSDAYYMQGGNISDRTWESDAVVKTSKDENAWYVEAFIPYYSFGANPEMINIWEKAGKKWAFNICRSRYAGKKPELSCWSPTYRGFHKPGNFGELSGLDIDFRTYDFNLKMQVEDTLRTDGGKFEIPISILLENRSGRNEKIKVIAELTGEKAKPVRMQKEVDAGNGKKLKIDFRPQLDSEGKYKINVKLAKAADDKILASSSIVRRIEYRPVTIVSAKPAWKGLLFYDQSPRILDIEIMTASDVPGKGYKLEVNLKELADGENISGKQIEVPERRFSLTLPIPQLKAGKYILEASLLKNGDKTASDCMPIRKLKEVRSMSRVDEEGRVLVNGKPFFPIGWYNVPKDQLEEYASYGFNFIHSIFPLNKDFSGFSEFLDKAAELNLKVITYPYSSYVMTRRIMNYNTMHLTEEEEKKIAQAVREWKNHPAIIGWNIYDEPECHMKSVEPMKEVSEILRKEDPYHVIVGANNSARGILSFGSVVDVLEPDLYVRVDHDGNRSSSFKRISVPIDIARKTYPGKPVWIMLLGSEFPAGTSKREREPSFRELRFQTYLAIAHGVKGANYYRWGHIKSPGVKTGMKHGLVPELKALAPAILAPGKEEVVSIPANDDILLKKYKGDYYLFAVNRDEKPLTLEFSIPALAEETKALRVVSEDRTVQLVKGKFKDTFEDLGVHIYTTKQEGFGLAKISDVQRQIDEAEAKLVKPGNLAHITKGTSTKCSSFMSFQGPDLMFDGIVTGNSYWSLNKKVKPPAWVEISFKKEIEIHKIIIYAEGLSDFGILTMQEGKWVKIEKISDNSKNKIIMELPSPIKTDRIKLDIGSGKGGELKIFEMEVY